MKVFCDMERVCGCDEGMGEASKEELMMRLHCLRVRLSNLTLQLLAEQCVWRSKLAVAPPHVFLLTYLYTLLF